MFSGTEDMLRRQALRELQEQIGGDPFDMQMVIAGESPPLEWIASASTVPFLSERRTVIVRNLLRASPVSEVFPNAAKLLTELPELARLVLVADEESSGDGDRSPRLNSARTQYEAIVKKAGGHVLEFKVDPKALKTELIKAASLKDRTMDDRTAELLLEMTGRNLSRALEELEKVAFFVGEGEKIRERDVSEVVMPSRDWNVFKLVDSMLEGNVGQSLAQLHVLMGSGMKAETAAMANIFPNLSRNLRLIWQARVCIEKRADPSDLRPEVLALLPEQPSLATASDWQKRKFMGAARKLTLAQIAECLEAVARTDARLKGMETGFSAAESLERMVLEMIETIRPPAAVRRS